MEAFNQRQGFLVSAIVHLLILMIVASRVVSRPDAPKPEPDSVTAEERRQAIFLPPPQVLRQLVPMPPRPSSPPRPEATPPPTAGKDRISIGPPSTERAKNLILRKEDDIMAVPKGQPSLAPRPPAPPAQATPEVAGGAPETKTAQGLRLPPGLGNERRGVEGSSGRPGPPGPSIASSLKNLDRQLQQAADLGLPGGTGQQVGPLFFDPQGADFTPWIKHFTSEIYRNWLPPQAALLGVRGHVEFEFTADREGRMTDLKMLKSSGNPGLDRAARNALLGSALLPLPSDYRPPQVTMRVTFFYNETPQGS